MCLKTGWYFIFVLAMLVVMLLYMQREAQAPYYATATLLIINQLSRHHRWNMARLMDFYDGCGQAFYRVGRSFSRCWTHYWCSDALWKNWQLSFRFSSVSRRKCILVAHHGSSNQLYPRYRHDCDSCLLVPRSDCWSCSHPWWPRQDSCPSFPSLLGDDFIHHAASCNRRISQRQPWRSPIQ